MGKFYLILISLFFVMNCSNYKKETHILDFNRFTIEIPKNWKKIENLRGIDSYVGGFVTEDGDSITFDLGIYSNSLQDDGPGIMERSVWESIKDSRSDIDSSNFIIIEDSVWVDTDIYRKRNIKWDTIDGYLTKIVFPVRSGDGVAGIYIDSLDANSYGEKIRFNLKGFNLKPQNEKLFLELIKTLKFNLKNN